MAKLDRLLSKPDQERVVAAIRAAEAKTSGEIKVHVEARCGGNPWQRALALFGELGLQKTRERNAVLIYVAVRSRKYALLGDSGIHEEVGSQFWSEAAGRMQGAFRREALADGIVGAIDAIGVRLAQKFPPRPPGENGEENEISDDISS